MKKLVLILVCFFSLIGFSQNLNQYKYAQVPSKFSFLNAKDEFNLNTLAKMFMEKYNFVTYFDTDNLPDDFLKDSCNKVYVDVISNNTLFKTKLTVVLKDCKNNILFTSAEGSSREKQYAVAYNQALRQAFASLEVLKHQYNPAQILIKTDEAPDFKRVQTNNTETIKATNFEEKKEVLGLSILELKNGLAVLNSDKKIIMYLYKSTLQNVYLADKMGIKGICYQKNNDWFFEYYENDSLKTEKMDIKL